MTYLLKNYKLKTSNCLEDKIVMVTDEKKVEAKAPVVAAPAKEAAPVAKPAAKKAAPAKKAAAKKPAAKKAAPKKLGKVIFEFDGQKIAFKDIEKKAAKLGGDVYVVASEKKIFDAEGKAVDLF